MHKIKKLTEKDIMDLAWHKMSFWDFLKGGVGENSFRSVHDHKNMIKPSRINFSWVHS